MTTFDSTDFDNAVSESGVAHESVANTDNNDASTVKRGYSYSGLPSIFDGLVGWWPLHDDSAQDYSGNGNDANNLNGVTTGVSGVGGIEAVDIDSGNYIQIGDSGELDGMSQVTASVWANFDSTVNANVLVKEGDQSICWGINSGFNGGGVEVTLVTENNGGTTVVVEDNFDLDSWNHYALTWDGSTLIGYKNGSQTASTSLNGNSVLNNANPVMFGANSEKGKNYYDGSVCDGRLYNRALSTSEIETIYEQGAAPDSDLRELLVRA